MTSTDPFNTSRLDETRLSPSGVIRKAEIARELQRDLATSVRTRRIARAAAASLPLIAITTAVVFFSSFGAPSSPGVSPRQAQQPSPSPPQPAPDQPASALTSFVVHVAQCEPAPPVMRHASFAIAASKPLDAGRIIDDRELTGVLSQRGMSAVIVRLAGRTIVADNATGREVRFAGPSVDSAPPADSGDSGSRLMPAESPRDSAA
jgi:hypothetical protein